VSPGPPAACPRRHSLAREVLLVPRAGGRRSERWCLRGDERRSRRNGQRLARLLRRRLGMRHGGPRWLRLGSFHLRQCLERNRRGRDDRRFLGGPLRHSRDCRRLRFRHFRSGECRLVPGGARSAPRDHHRDRRDQRDQEDHRRDRPSENAVPRERALFPGTAVVHPVCRVAGKAVRAADGVQRIVVPICLCRRQVRWLHGKDRNGRNRLNGPVRV
jgi:hypothetical protein